MNGAEPEGPDTGRAVDADIDKDRTCYEQNCESARGINRQLNQLPVLAITLTGGLWYGGVVAEGVEEVSRFGVLCFAAICNICLVFASMRIRDVLQSHLEKMEAFNPECFASGRPEQPMLPPFGRNSMITIYSVLMIMAALLSMAGAVVVHWPNGWGEWARVLVSLLSLGAVVVTLYFLWPRKTEAPSNGQ